MKDFELRYLRKKTISASGFDFGNLPVLQFRATSLGDNGYVWSEWEDVPVADKNLSAE